MGIEANGPKQTPRVGGAGVRPPAVATGKLGAQPHTAPLGRDERALKAAPSLPADPKADPLATYPTTGGTSAPGAWLAAADPVGQVAIKDFATEFQSLVKDGSLSKTDLALLEARIPNIRGGDLRVWARQALDDVKKNSTKGPDGSLLPKNDIVKSLITPARIDAVYTRLAEARSHPILDTIKDPEARDQMRSYLKRYMTDPTFMAVHDARTLNWGVWNNFKQSVGSIFAEREIGDNSVDGLFGGCVECQARMGEMFKRFEKDWKADPANAGKTFKLSAGDMQTRSAVGFQHNFAFVKTAGGETFYTDPWSAQDTTRDTIQTKKAWLDDMKDGAFGLILGPGNLTWAYEAGQEVYNPGDGDMAVK